jgi:hypothetical protein
MLSRFSCITAQSGSSFRAVLGSPLCVYPYTQAEFHCRTRVGRGELKSADGVPGCALASTTADGGDHFVDVICTDTQTNPNYNQGGCYTLL